MLRIIEKKIVIKKDQDFGFLTAYIPFRAKLLKCENNFKSINEVKEESIETKLILKTVKNNINDNVRFYCAYRNRLWLDENKETVIQKSEVTEEFQSKVNSIEEIIKRNKRLDPYIKDTAIKISDISFSLYNDNSYKQNGFLKVTIQIDFQEGLNEEEKGKIISFVYDVISRNVKNKFDKDSEDFRIEDGDNGIYDLLINLFDGFVIDWFDSKKPFINGKRRMKTEADDWVFNYDNQDRRCYTFAFYTIDKNIKEYNDPNLNTYLYQITRIHENGNIRTYNDNNDIFSVYRDDTSAVWGVSRVGLGSIIVQEDDKEKFRNIKVLFSDFSLIYEFCLHQKFFSYSLIDNEEKRSEKESNLWGRIKRWYERRQENQYLIRKLDLTKYIDLFCPTIISEFETQDVYDLIRKKIEVDRLMNDAKNTLNYLEATKQKQINTRNTWISAIVSMFVFPLTVSKYITSYSSASETLSETVSHPVEVFTFNGVFLILFVAGLVLWLLQYLLTNRYKK